MAKIVISNGIIHSDDDFNLTSGDNASTRACFRICKQRDSHTKLRSLSSFRIKSKEFLNTGDAEVCGNLTVHGTCTTLNTTLTATTTETENNFVIVSTDSGAAAAPDLKLYRNSASPAAGDDVGHIKFSGNDSAGNETIYAGVFGCLQCATSTTECGMLVFEVACNGTTIQPGRIEQNGIWSFKNYYISGTGSLRNYGNQLNLTTGGGAYDISFQPNSVEKMRITSGGNVGIGTTAPGGKLESYITSGGDKGLRLNSNFAGGNTVDFIPAIVGVSNNGFSIDLAGTNRLVINSNGNVGIGTNAPDQKLSVTGNIQARSGYWFIARSADNAGYSYLKNPSTSGSEIAFHTSGEKMRLLSNGNFGIGTTSPGAKLEIDAGGTTNILLGVISNSTTYNAISLNGNMVDAGKLGLAGGGSGNPNLYIDVPSTGQHVFRVATSQKVVFDASGKVGIGTTAPNGQLHISRAAPYTAPSLQIDNTTTNAYIHSAHILAPNITSGQTHVLFIGRAASTKNAGYIGYKYSSAGSDDNVLTLGHWSGNHLVNIKGDGNVGIGTDSPGYPLDVQFAGDSGIRAKSSSSHASIFLTSASAAAAYVRFSDNGGNRYWIQSTSDEKLYFRPIATSTTANQIIFDSAGNVGIGTSAPAYKLDVSGTARLGALTGTTATFSGLLNLEAVGTSDDPAIQLKRNGSQTIGAKLWYDNSAGDVYLDNWFDSANGDIYFRTRTSSGNSATRLTIKGNGIVDVTGALTGTSATFSTCLQSPIVCATSCLRTEGVLKFNYPSNCGPYLETGGTYTAPNLHLKHFNGNTNYTGFAAGRVCGTVCLCSPIVCATSCIRTGMHCVHGCTTMGSTGNPQVAGGERVVLRGYSTQYDSGGSGCRLSSSGFLEFWSAGNWTGTERRWAMTNAYCMGNSSCTGNLAFLLGGYQVSPVLANNGSLGTGTSIAMYITRDKYLCVFGCIQSPIVCATTCVRVGSTGTATIKQNASYPTLELQAHGNELMIGAGGSDIHINYRATTTDTPDNWYWRAGSSTSYSNHNWGIGCGHTRLQSPVLCATTCVKSPTLCATSCIASPILRATNTATIGATTAPPETFMVCGNSRFVRGGSPVTIYMGCNYQSVDVGFVWAACQDLQIKTYSGGWNQALRVLGTNTYACGCLQSPTLCATTWLRTCLVKANILEQNSGASNLCIRTEGGTNRDIVISPNGTGTTCIQGNLCVTGNVIADGMEGDELTSVSCRTEISCFNTSCITGNSAVYDVFVSVNPNCDGSTSYRDIHHLTTYVTTGYSGSSVCRYINSVQNAAVGGYSGGAGGAGACASTTVSAVLHVGGTQAQSFAASCATCLAILICGGYSGGTNCCRRAAECVVIKRIL